MLGTDAQSYGSRRDVLLLEFLGCHLRVGRGVGMNHQALHIGNVGQEREDLQGINKFPGLLLAALDLKGEDAAAAIGEVLLVEGMVRMCRQAGMVHLSHLRMICQELDHLQGILHMTLHAQAQRFHTLQQNKGIEGRNGSTGITQNHGTNTGNEGCRPCHVGKHGTMIRGIGLSQCGIFVGVCLPVKLTSVNDDTTQAAAVSTQELSSRMYHDVCSMLQRTNQEGRAERVIHDKHNVMLVGYGSYGLQIGHVAVGIAERLGIYYFCVGLNGCFQCGEVIHVDDGVRDALRVQRVSNQAKRTAVEVVGCHDVVACLHNVLQGVSHSSGTTGDGQASHATLKGSHAVF